jgi:phospholipid/cholesterol/gamma-HCH transport system substrate-binding protein
MQKQAPSLAKVLSMVVFALSCIGLLMFLWLSFGGSIPLKPKSYRFEASVPEATTLAQEADVRLAGVTVGRVKQKELQRSGQGTLVTFEIEPQYAPIPRDSRLMLRQKTLLGETYVEITPGDRRKGELPDGGRLRPAQVAETVELDEIFQAFDPETKKAFRAWVGESATAIEGGRGRDLSEALANLDDFFVDGADVLGVLDRQDRSLRQLIRNTGVVFGALSEREGELRELVVNSGRTFDALASRDEALEESFRIFPTFLDESRTTLARLEGFSRETRPLVRELQPVADDLGPTVEDVAALAPDLRQLFRDLDPLIVASRRNSPDLHRVLRGASPLVDALHPFFQELNPFLSFANYDQVFLSTFISHGAYATGAALPPLPGTSRRHYLRAYGPINERSLSLNQTRPKYDRGNAYPAPQTYTRAQTLGFLEVFDCSHVGGQVEEPVDRGAGPSHEEYPVCYEQPPFTYNGKHYPRLGRGEVPLEPAPDLYSIDGLRSPFPSER